MVLGICRSQFRGSPFDLTTPYRRIDKRMFTPSEVPNWMIIIYERPQRFSEQVANQLATDLVTGCEAVGAVTQIGAPWSPFNAIFIGIHINARPALIKWESGQGIISQVCHFVAGFFKDGLIVTVATSFGRFGMSTSLRQLSDTHCRHPS